MKLGLVRNLRVEEGLVLRVLALRRIPKVSLVSLSSMEVVYVT